MILLVRIVKAINFEFWRVIFSYNNSQMLFVILMVNYRRIFYFEAPQAYIPNALQSTDEMFAAMQRTDQCT